MSGTGKKSWFPLVALGLLVLVLTGPLMVAASVGWLDDPAGFIHRAMGAFGVAGGAVLGLVLGFDAAQKRLDLEDRSPAFRAQADNGSLSLWAGPLLSVLPGIVIGLVLNAALFHGVNLALRMTGRLDAMSREWGGNASWSGDGDGIVWFHLYALGVGYTGTLVTFLVLRLRHGFRTHRPEGIGR